VGERRICALVLAAALVPAAAAGAVPALACPAGTTQRRTYYADEFWCARPDGTRHGPYRNGWASPVEEGAYRDGKRDGWWRRWSNGVLIDERRYDRDREDGLARTWSEKGALLSSGVMSRGKQVGLWRWWHANGQLMAQGRFVRGREVGRHTSWSADGTVVTDGRYRNGKREGPWLDADPERDETGRGRYVDGEREGRWKLLSAEGKPSIDANYHRGRRNGLWTVRDPDDPTRIWKQGTYRRGRRHGRWIFRDLSSTYDVVIADCRNGEPHGRVIWRITETGGDYVAGYEIIAHYARGMLDGWWTENGPLGAHEGRAERGLYRKGLLVRGDDFDDNRMGVEEISDSDRFCGDGFDDG
jgi:antitoxin component YwqK of YwqJK toxin-antitoxin module